MSSSEEKGNDSHNIEEGSMDSIVESRYAQEGESQGSNPSQVAIGWIPLGAKIVFKCLKSLERMANTKNDPKKKDKEKVEEVAIGSYRPRKVSVVLDFPPDCGRSAAFVKRKDYVRMRRILRRLTTIWNMIHQCVQV
ncbi:Uncharacterized protein TCM_043652 [Theobroma cacao]|uniref:Uncharacterized protein n=1 Tax=Theobroma cacao TaxID=3641 RepID=A0A061FPM5_THECC|nr:Uncharacterized protein TCM_043652 [Theobroma cacao]